MTYYRVVIENVHLVTKNCLFSYKTNTKELVEDLFPRHLSELINVQILKKWFHVIAYLKSCIIIFGAIIFGFGPFKNVFI